MERENLNKPYYCSCCEKMVKPRGRPRYYTDEERRQRKTDYMLHKEWFCEICNNDHNYTLAGKHKHLKSKKHHVNYIKSKEAENFD